MSRQRIKSLRPRLAPKPAAQGWQPDSVRGNRHERGYGVAWDRLRVRILERDAGLCQQCGHPGNEVDHKLPKAMGGTDDEENLQVLCNPCHSAKTARESGGFLS